MADKLIGDYPVPNFTVHKGDLTEQQQIANKIKDKISELNDLMEMARLKRMSVKIGQTGCVASVHITQTL